jgi:hypothetical protein
MKQNKPDIATLNQLIRYESGMLFWRERPASLFNATGSRSAAGCASQWNKRYAGTEAFTHVGTHGYRVGNFLGTVLLAHRVIYAMHKGAWDFDKVDHIDGDKLNNVTENLRECSNAENLRNQRGNGGRGLPKGVYAHKGRYIASICKDYKAHHLGVFDTPEQARSAYNLAAVKFHGDFARLSSE